MATYEDLVEGGEDAGDPYFDGSEFAIRTALEDEHYWHVHRRAIILHELRAAGVREEAKLIELGCGIGTVATHLNQHGYHVDYSDVFGAALEIAAQRSAHATEDQSTNREFLRMDITKPLPRKDYDGFLMFDVIEHLPDDNAVMGHIADALQPGGVAMVTVPAFNMLWSPWDDMEKHKRRYTRSELVQLFERHGFDVTRASYFFSPLFFAACGMKMVRKLLGFVTEPKETTDISEMTEAKNTPWLNQLMLGVLAPERAWLPTRSLPLGTSLLAIGHKR